MNERGKGNPGGKELRAGELEEPLREEALREIERSLHGKLKAHRLSDSFIERCGEEAIQRGLLDYLRAREAGKDIESRDAFIVHAAFHRAIQELRREARQVDGSAVEALLEGGRHAAPASEELALEQLQAQELHAAIEELPSEARQLLALHYFERLSAKRAAEHLYYSEATYRRRLRRALSALGGRLGVAPPEPDSELALEVGVAAWASIGGARVALARGPFDQVAGLVDRGRDGLAWVLSRLRDPLARAEASGTTETAGAIASGPAGKVLGGCAAAAVACVVGGVVGPGIALHTSDAPPRHATAAREKSRPHRAPGERPGVESAASRVVPSAGAAPAPGGRTSARRAQTRQTQEPRNAEQRRVEEQVSGFARAEAEYAAPSEAEASSAEPEAVSVTPTSGGGGASSSEAAAREFSFEGRP